MFKVKFETGGLGYSGVSGGGLYIYVIRNNYLKLFQGTCQGTSLSAISTDEFKVTNEIEGYDTSVLLDLNLFDLKLEIPTPFGCYNPIELTFQLFERESMDPIFQTSRRPMATGFSLGELSILAQPGQMRLRYKGSYSHYKDSLNEYAAKQLKDNLRRDMNAGVMY